MTEARKGEIFIFIAGLLWAFFPVITVLSYQRVPAITSLAWSTLLAAAFFAVVMTYRRKWSELRDPMLWLYSFAIAFFIGVFFYGLYYTGLKFTTPGNAAIIALFEVFTSFIFFHLLRREYISRGHKIGAVLMVVGAIIVLGKNFSGINAGDFLVLLAVCCSPAGNLLQQKARKIASSESIMFLRSVMASPVLFALAAFLGEHASAADVQASLVFLAINGVLLLGLSKILWIESIHRISVTKGVALSSIDPFLTLLIAWVVLGQVPDMWQLTSLVPLVAGVLMLTDTIHVSAQ